MPVTIHAVGPDPLSSAEVERWRAVSVAVAVDLGPEVGLVDPAVRPLRPPGQQPRLFGRAVTARCEPPDFGAVPLAIDRIRPGEILVIAAGGHAETAMIGEILGERLRERGAAGLVCDGAIRDVGTLGQWTDFPVYTRHVTPRGPSSAERGGVNAPVVCAGVLIRPGDLLIGDDDGLAVLGPETLRTRIGDAEAKLGLEAAWQESLATGRTLAEIFGLAKPIDLGGAETNDVARR